MTLSLTSVTGILTLASTILAAPQATPTSTEATLPYPYTPYPATITLTTDTRGAPLASAKINSQNACGRRQNWLNTTTVDLQLPCLGATQLETSVYHGGCPLGGHGAPPEGTIQNTKTKFNFVCSPTPNPHPHAVPTDWETDLPAPTLPAGFKPAYTPVSVHAASYAEGWCYQRVYLDATDASVRTRDCEVCETCRAPTAYTKTVTTTVGVDCKPFAGKCTFMPLEVSGTATCRTSVPVESRAATVTAKEAKTTWAYECLPTKKP